MRYGNVKLIAAIGNFGQIGDKGRLPWDSPKDLAHFKRMTMNDICIVGRRTAEGLPPLPGRDVVVWHRDRDIPAFIVANLDRTIWVCGGAHIYRTWMPYVSMSIISHIDFDRKCDTYMPFLWRFARMSYKKVKDAVTG